LKEKKKVQAEKLGTVKKCFRYAVLFVCGSKRLSINGKFDCE